MNLFKISNSTANINDSIHQVYEDISSSEGSPTTAYDEMNGPSQFTALLDVNEVVIGEEEEVEEEEAAEEEDENQMTVDNSPVKKLKSNEKANDCTERFGCNGIVIGEIKIQCVVSAEAESKLVKKEESKNNDDAKNSNTKKNLFSK